MNRIAIALRSLIFFLWAFFACWTAGTSVVIMIANARLRYGAAASTIVSLIVAVLTFFTIIISHTELRYPRIRTGTVAVELAWVGTSAALQLAVIGLAFGVDGSGCGDTDADYCANTALFKKLVVAMTVIAWAYLVLFCAALCWRWRPHTGRILRESIFEIDWLARQCTSEEGRSERSREAREVHGVFDDMASSASVSTPRCISPPPRSTSRQPVPETPTPLWAKQRTVRRGIDPPFIAGPSQEPKPLQRARHHHRHRQHRPSHAVASAQPTLSAQPSMISATVVDDMSYIARSVSPIISELSSARHPEQELQSLPSLAEMVANRVIRPPPRQTSLGAPSGGHRRRQGDPIDRPMFHPPTISERHGHARESEDLTRFYYL